MRPRVQRGFFPAVLGLCLVLPSFALDRAAGMELGFLSVPVLTPDPYSFAASAGLWHEWSGLGGTPLVVGAWFGAAGFRPMDEAFGPSVMYYGGLEAGYGFSLLEGDHALISLRPLARFGWYYRSVEIQGVVEWGSRPFLSAGAALGILSGGLDLGLSVLLSVPMDNRPVLLFGFLQRIGLWY